MLLNSQERQITVSNCWPNFGVIAIPSSWSMHTWRWTIG